LAGDAGLRSVANRGEEVFELEAERLDVGEIEFGEGEAGGWMRDRWRLTCRSLHCIFAVRLRRLRSRGQGCGYADVRGGELLCDEGGVDLDGEEFLAGEVEGEILMRLEEAELADLLGAYAAGGEVSDAAGLEFDADVRDVDAGREDGEAHGADFADG